MTTAAMVLSVVPLVIATGAGAVGRNHMGLVIFTRISIGTLFTLFVVPAMYLWLAADHKGAPRLLSDEGVDMGKPKPGIPRGPMVRDPAIRKPGGADLLLV